MIPILDLKAQYESIKDEINAAIAEVLESTRFILGPNVAAFEEEVADRVSGRRLCRGRGLGHGCPSLNSTRLRRWPWR